jgi:hypothetical protein
MIFEYRTDEHKNNRRAKMDLFRIALFSLFLFGVTHARNQTEIPISRQASMIEVYSSSEVAVRATGMDKKDKTALVDARKTAVYFLLYLGTDPILNTADAKRKFEAIAETFFLPENIAMYISWESNKLVSRVKGRLPNGKNGYKITKDFRVNKKLLKETLTNKGIISVQSEIAEAVGLPQIMVIPEAPAGQTPIQVFDSNPYAKQAAGTIESFLTAQKYEVVVPRSSEQIRDVVEATDQDAGFGAVDISYRLALLMGSDIYIVFSGQVDNQQARVVTRAYETTTARLLGTETGYSKVRPGVAAEALVEEAINSSIENVLSRITSYWTDDIRYGIQYKLIFKFDPEMPQTSVLKVQGAISDLVDEAFDRAKENVVTQGTMDYLVWAKNDKFNRSSKILRYFQQQLSGNCSVSQISINRKLIIVGIGE